MRRLLFPVILAITLAGCGGSDGDSSPAAPTTPTTPTTPTVTVTGLTVTGAGCTIAVTVSGPIQAICANNTVGGALQLTATAQLSNSTTEDVSSKAQWTSSFTNVATVSSTGLVTLKAAGETDVIATYQGKSAGHTIRVQPAGPKTQFGAGQYLVNKDIAAGRYYADPASGCYWERQEGLGGTTSDIIANDFVGFNAGQIIVDILSKDLAFETDSDCGTWYNSPRRGLQANITMGTWLVGSQITPGTYRANVAYGCYWERLRDFTGEIGGIISNDFVSSAGTKMVEIKAGDVGFNSDDDCGEWTRISTVAGDGEVTVGAESRNEIERNKQQYRQTSGLPSGRLK